MGRHVAVKRARMEMREADWSAAARARARLRKGTRKKTTVVRETKGDACVLPPEMQESPRGTMEEST